MPQGVSGCEDSDERSIMKTGKSWLFLFVCFSWLSAWLASWAHALGEASYEPRFHRTEPRSTNTAKLIDFVRSIKTLN